MAIEAKLAPTALGAVRDFTLPVHSVRQGA